MFCSALSHGGIRFRDKIIYVFFRIRKKTSEQMSTTLEHQTSVKAADIDEGLYSRQL